MRSSTSAICSALRDRLELALGQLDREVEVALVPGVDDRAAAAGRRRAAAPTVSIGRCVADSPTRLGRASHSASSRSSVSARCEPRLSRATAWISSTITVSIGAQRVAAARAR